MTTSWDDSEDSLLEIANLLKSMNLKGTFYVDPGRPAAVNDTGLRAVALDHELGSHTWSHPNLKLCDEQRMREEFTSSRNYLESVSGEPIVGLAYPYGKHTPAAERMASECGYLFARTTDPRCVQFPPDNPYCWGISWFAQAKTKSYYQLSAPRSHPFKPLLFRSLFSKRTLLSSLARMYLEELTFDWRKLALRFFDRARASHGVWHLMGHPAEIADSPRLKDELTEVLRRVAGKSDVWYTTNGALFLSEKVKSKASVAETHSSTGSLFQISAKCPVPAKAPLPLRLVIPRDVARDWNVEILTAHSAGFQVERSEEFAWIDTFDTETTVEVKYRRPSSA